MRNLRFNYVGFWFVIVGYFVLLNNYVNLCLQKQLFLINSDIPHFFVHSNYLWKLPYSYVAFWFVNLLYLFLRQSYIINAFLQWHIFHDLRSTLFCGTFTLSMEITLQLLFLPFCLSLWSTFYYITITSFICSMKWRFLITFELVFGKFKLSTEVTL